MKSESQRSNLQASVERLQRNQRLIALKTSFSGGPALETLRIEPVDATRRERLGGMYRQWGFRSLLSELGLPWEGPDQECCCDEALVHSESEPAVGSYGSFGDANPSAGRRSAGGRR